MCNITSLVGRLRTMSAIEFRQSLMTAKYRAESDMEKRGYVDPDWTPTQGEKAASADKRAEVDRLDNDLTKLAADTVAGKAKKRQTDKS